MLGIVFSLFSIFLLVFMLYKKINAHMALLLSGLLLLSLAAIFGLSPHIVAKG
ncbi:C4-dicarboxylate ABC transporter, partial [Campylobacter coli]|nr:C4-dicarboxylate ABC transporter [Campylobacter coli]